jgi:hypothetical protein
MQLDFHGTTFFERVYETRRARSWHLGVLLGVSAAMSGELPTLPVAYFVGMAS